MECQENKKINRCSGESVRYDLALIAQSQAVVADIIKLTRPCT